MTLDYLKHIDLLSMAIAIGKNSWERNVQTFDWFSIGQKIDFGFSSDFEEGVHVGLVKKIKGNMVAIIISNRDKDKVTPNMGDTLHFFPEKDGHPWDVVGEVTQNGSHPLLVLKFDNEPTSVGAEEAVEEPDIPELDLPVVEEEKPDTEDFGIALSDDEDEGDDEPFALETEESDIPELDLPIVEEEKPATEDFGIALSDDEDDEPFVIDAGESDIPELDPPVAEEEKPATEDFGIEMSDYEDDEPFAIETEEPGVPELDLPLMDDDEPDTGDFGIEMSDDEDDEPFVLETERTNVSELDIAITDEEEHEIEPVGIVMSDEENELDDDGPMLIASDAEDDDATPSLDIDSHIEETEETDIDTISDEPEEAEPIAPTTVEDEPETAEGESEVTLGDMSESMSGGDSDEKSLASEIEAATNGFNTIAATPFPDFFPVALHAIEPADVSSIATSVESGDYDSGDQAYVDGIDLKSIDPDLQSVFSALLKKIGRVEKAVGGASLTGPHENAICLLLKPKRAYLFSLKSYDIEESVALNVDHFWNPELSFRAVGSVSLCESEVGGYVVTVSFTHLSPKAEENIKDYLSRGREFYNSLEELAQSKIS